MLIYPYELEKDANYPSRADFAVRNCKAGKGFGVYTKKDHKRGNLVARFSGSIVNDIMQHSLQINPSKHLYDPYFSGLLLHSCNPNAALDMQDFTIWALKDIEAGEALTMDYASTEDYLYKQFKCLCGSDSCRHWISGRREAVNEEGESYLRQFFDDDKIVLIRKTA